MVNYIRRFLAWDGCLLVCSIVGVGVGFSVGFAFYHAKASPTTLLWIGLPGELYLRMLKAAILPLVISSIITGTASLKPKENGWVGAVAMSYITITNIIGAIVGVVLAVIIKPGTVVETEDTASSATVDTGNLQTSDLFADLIRNLIPSNLVSACFEKTQTRYRQLTLSSNGDGNNSSNSSIAEYERYLGVSSGTNVLGLVTACAAIGIAAGRSGEAATPFLSFFRACTDVILLLLRWLVMFTPVGAASLIAKSVGSTSDVEDTFRGLGLFVLAETAGNLLLICVVLQLIYFVFLRQNPLLFLVDAARPAITAMVGPSSAVAMPEILNCSETRYGVDSRVSRFVVPIAASLNRDGSAMFIALTSTYMAQISGAAGADSIILITVLTAVGSLAIPAVHSASVVTVLMITASLDIPPANIGILLALEWFSDRIRSFTNGYSHVLCCVVAWRLCKDSLLTSPVTPPTEYNQPEDKAATAEEKVPIVMDDKDTTQSL